MSEYSRNQSRGDEKSLVERKRIAVLCACACFIGSVTHCLTWSTFIQSSLVIDRLLKLLTSDSPRKFVSHITCNEISLTCHVNIWSGSSQEVGVRISLWNGVVRSSNWNTHGLHSSHFHSTWRVSSRSLCCSYWLTADVPTIANDWMLNVKCH